MDHKAIIGWTLIYSIIMAVVMAAYVGNHMKLWREAKEWKKWMIRLPAGPIVWLFWFVGIIIDWCEKNKPGSSIVDKLNDFLRS